MDYAQAKLEAGVEVEETKAFLRKISEDYAPLECSKKAAEVLERWASER
ncbi:MAG: hypothetical protein HY716_02750 [Planctomycetes bacterium]|nr:hypothetical protein [Planctomycetota bacterium]